MKFFVLSIIFLVVPFEAFSYIIDEYSPAYILVTIGSEKVKLYAIPSSNIEFSKEGIYFYDIKGRRIKSDQVIMYQGLYFLTKIPEK